MRAFVENGNIFCADNETLVPRNALTIDVPDGTSPFDIVFDGHVLRLKTEAEKEADRKQQEKQEALQKLAETDAKMARVIEDIIDVLVAKKVIDYNDLAQEVQDKINERKLLREKLK